MGKGAKAKGSSYEREFVRICIESGLSARRVPLSGAMAGYPDDVVVEDIFRVECKYRKKGFKRIYEWSEGWKVMVLPESGLTLYRIDAWTEIVAAMINGGPHPGFLHTTKNVTPQRTLLGWLGESDALGIRAAHRPWYVAMPHI